jgi:hypothetical protein
MTDQPITSSRRPAVIARDCAAACSDDLREVRDMLAVLSQRPEPSQCQPQETPDAH